jgi:aspartate kinase
MNSKPKVQKFGGSSLENAAAFDRVSRIIQARQTTGTVIVTSAMRGVTDALLESARLAQQCRMDDALHIIASQLDRHTQVARTLLSAPAFTSTAARITAARANIIKLLELLATQSVSPEPLLDEISSYGELLSTTLLAAVLREKGLPAREVDARRCIITDDAHGCANPVHDATMNHTRAELEPIINSSSIPVLGGFIASSASGATTTLGRNGSDYTAALVGAAVSAGEVQIWTDVAGVLSADPRLVINAHTVRRLSYAEAETLAYFGAKVLYPKAIPPLARLGIPLRVCNSFMQDGETCVSAPPQILRLAVKAIVHKQGIAILQTPKPVAAYQQMRLLEWHCAALDILSSPGECRSLTLVEADVLSGIRAELEQFGSVLVEEDRAIVCLVGEGLRFAPWVAARVFDLLGEIKIRLVAQEAPSAGLLFVVEAAQAGEIVARLHESFFGDAENDCRAWENCEPEKAYQSERTDYIRQFTIDRQSLSWNTPIPRRSDE